jgi:hypothetical protein
MSRHPSVVLDAALRFAKSNPELLHYALDNAATVGSSVDDLLRQAIDRVVAERATPEATRTTPLRGRPLLRAL